MRRVYQRFMAEEMPDDAVVVSIGGADTDHMTVRVIWPTRFADRSRASENQQDVQSALAFADRVAECLALHSIVVAIGNPAIWKPDWGTLAE